MANRVFEKTAFADEAKEFAENLAGRSPLALRYTKEALRFATTASLGDTITKEADLQEFCISSEDCPNAVAAFFAKKPYTWKGR
jgi:2-(1,2-epoxy-1,2-dihydrophenyl)acetyl-CoA isomerase